MTKRGKDFGRGVINREAWRGTIPEHFIGMEDHDRRMKDGKDLLKDLMTPKFLHEVRFPRITMNTTLFTMVTTLL